MDEFDRIAEVERKVENLSRRIDDLAAKTGQQIPYKAEYRVQSGGRLFWGLAFLFAGMYWTADHMGWLGIDIPLVSMMLIVLGLYMLVSSRR
jgi:hypothetical protein